MTDLKNSIPISWSYLLKEEFQKKYFQKLELFVSEAYQNTLVYPPAEHVFKAFESCSLLNLKVVIIGQDPYHGQGQAHGLSFSVDHGVPIPPTLRNIFKELKSDLNVPIPTSGNLAHWANQGVFLLNATLTVQSKSPGSHQKQGWEEFTDHVIGLISEQKSNVVFILWGAFAQKKMNLINETKHLIIRSVHPSPFSARNGFFGSKPFSKTNDYLTKHSQEAIKW